VIVAGGLSKHHPATDVARWSQSSVTQTSCTFVFNLCRVIACRSARCRSQLERVLFNCVRQLFGSFRWHRRPFGRLAKPTRGYIGLLADVPGLIAGHHVACRQAATLTKTHVQVTLDIGGSSVNTLYVTFLFSIGHETWRTEPMTRLFTFRCTRSGSSALHAVH